MAVTPSLPDSGASLPDAGFDVPDDPGEIFPAILSRDDRVCHRCLTRLRRQTPFPQEDGFDYGSLLSFVEVSNPEEDRIDHEFLERTEVPDRLQRGWTEDGRTAYCAECGTTEPHQRPPTRSLEDARRHATNLSATLHELDIGHDWLLLVRLVEEMRSRHTCGGDDVELFRRATAKAVARARGQ